MRFLHTVKTAFRPPICFTQSCWRFFQIPVKEVQKCLFNSNTIKQKQKIDLACSRVFGQDILSCKIYDSFEENFLEVFSIRASLKNWSEWRGTFQTPPSHLFLWDLISWLSRSAHIFYQFPALVLSTTSSPSLAFFYRQRQQNGIFCTQKWDKAGSQVYLELHLEKRAFEVTIMGGESVSLSQYGHYWHILSSSF